MLLWLILLVFVKTLSTNLTLFYLLAASAIGFYLPNMVLGRMVQARQLEIFEKFPGCAGPDDGLYRGRPGHRCRYWASGG